MTNKPNFRNAQYVNGGGIIITCKITGQSSEIIKNVSKRMGRGNKKMVKQTFEEKFPWLIIKVQQGETLKDLHYSMWTMERLLEDIDKFCFSKQRVKEIIKKIEILMVETHGIAVQIIFLKNWS